MGKKEMIELSSTDRILVLGDSGSGKTFLATKISKSFKRVLVVSSDPTEFKEFPNRITTINPEATRKALSETYSKGNLLAVVDDTDNFFTRFENDERVRAFLILSRHRNTGWIIIARRPTDLPPLVFTQANKIFIFQTDHPRELALYDSYISPGVGETIKALDRQAHNFFFYNRDTRETKVMVV
jgi:DNA helicase HerA-like ATPase